MATDDGRGGEPLIFPIGCYTGTLYEDPYTVDRHHNVMIGAQLLQLNDDQLAVWLLARGVPEHVVDRPWTRQLLREEAAKAGVANPEQVLAGLAADGLVVETAPGTEHSIDFAESYRFIPLMLGLGNTSEEPWLYRIGFFQQPVITVAGEVYSMWEWAHVDNNLWAACHAYADTSKQSGSADPDDTVPERVLTGFLGAIHPLLTAGAAYLDLAWLDEAGEVA